MTLNFSKTFPKGSGSLEGKPTRFIEKTLECLNVYQLTNFFEWNEKVCDLEEMDFFDMDFLNNDPQPKIHTIRKYKKLRWKPGMMIHFKIWTGKPYCSPTFNFAPLIPCSGTEKVEIKWEKSKGMYKRVRVFVSGTLFADVSIETDNPFFVFNYGNENIKTLSNNDGFDNVKDFFEWFNEDFEGWIIHWTPFRYNVNKIEVFDEQLIDEP